MQVFHFGSARHRLFGIYHPAARVPRPPVGVVICPPFGHEYIRTHRTLRTLATRLSALGVHVLKFDYFGCGDSAGGADEGGVAQWQSDVATAIDEIKDMAGLQAVSIVGVRLGATLGAMATATRRDVRTLVMWDPIMRGSGHIDELRRLQSGWLKTRPKVKGPVPPADAELIGFPLGPALSDELNAIDLSSQTKWTPRRIITLSTSGMEHQELRQHLTTSGVASEFEQIPCDCQWFEPASVHLQLLANEAIVRIETIFQHQAVS
jgi:pimeloyl-ACP methyl ester carboxylesterase